MIDDIILNKKESIERCVKQIRLYYSRNSGLPFGEDYLKQDAIALNLQRAAEQCIDLANHIVRLKKLGIPKESREGFSFLATEKIIPQELASRLHHGSPVITGRRTQWIQQISKGLIRMTR